MCQSASRQYEPTWILNAKARTRQRIEVKEATLAYIIDASAGRQPQYRTSRSYDPLHDRSDPRRRKPTCQLQRILDEPATIRQQVEMKETILVRYHTKTLSIRHNEHQQKHTEKSPTLDMCRSAPQNSRNQQREHTTFDPTQKTANHPTQRAQQHEPTIRPQSRWTRKMTHPRVERAQRQTLEVCETWRTQQEELWKTKRVTQRPRRETAKHATQQQSSSTTGGASTSKKYHTQDQEYQELPSEEEDRTTSHLSLLPTHTGDKCRQTTTHMLLESDCDAQVRANDEPDATNDEIAPWTKYVGRHAFGTRNNKEQ